MDVMITSSSWRVFVTVAVTAETVSLNVYLLATS
jgi:hypothetical protein